MDQIDQIRSQTDIVELIGSYISLKKAGRNFKALCPFHSEKTPSFVVSPERQIFKCFGCGMGGDVFKFLMEYEKMTFGEALRFLADKAGITLKKFKPSTAQKEKDILLAINHLAAEFYHFILLNHRLGKKGLNYLLQRGISKSSIQLFKLGYAPESWDNLNRYLISKKGFKLNEVEKTGLIIKSKNLRYYDRFRGRIIFPLTNHRSDIVGFSGRILKAEETGAKYVNTPETIIYHKGELLYGLSQTKSFIKKKNKMIIVEGELDAISSFQAGVKNVVAIKGSALTEAQVNLIKRYTSTIILALDADSAGEAAVKRGIEIADKAGLNIRIAQPKYGKDPDECARHSPLMWRKSIAESMPIFDFYLQSAVHQFNPIKPEGKKRISEELIPLISKINNEIIKAHYIKKLANILDTNEEAVIQEIERNNNLKKINYRKQIDLSSKRIKLKEQTRKDRLEEFILSLILQKTDRTNELIKQIKLEYFIHPAVKKIIGYLKTFSQKRKQPKFKINKFANVLPEELREILDRLYLQDIRDILKSDKEFLKQFQKAKTEIEKLYLKDLISKVVIKIREKEKNNNKKDFNLWQKKFTDLSKRLQDLSK